MASMTALQWSIACCTAVSCGAAASCFCSVSSCCIACKAGANARRIVLYTSSAGSRCAFCSRYPQVTPLPKAASPSSGWRSPYKMRKRVVLPVPLAPMMPMRSPRSTLALTSFKTSCSPKLFPSCFSSSSIVVFLCVPSFVVGPPQTRQSPACGLRRLRLRCCGGGCARRGFPAPRAPSRCGTVPHSCGSRR